MSSTTTAAAAEKFGPVKNSHKEEYIAVGTVIDKAIKIHVIGCKSKSVISNYTVTPEDVKPFLAAIPTMFDGAKCKGILFDIYKFEPAPSDEYPHVINFCFAIRLHLDHMQIKHFFYADKSLFLSGLLISAKLSAPVEDEVVLFLLSKADEIFIYEYRYTEKGYEKIRDATVTVSEKEGFAEIREKILGESKPNHIIVFGADLELPILKHFKKTIFAQEKLTFCDKQTIAAESIKHSLKISKRLHDPSYVKYHVIPTNAKKWCIYADGRSPFITINAGDKLPVRFEDYTFRHFDVYAVSGFDDAGENERYIYETIQDSTTRHRSKICFYVDYEGFPTLFVRPIIIDLIKELPPRLDEKLTKKIPVIVLCDNFSVICAVKKGEETYDFLEDWNGLYGKDDTLFLDGINREFGCTAKDLKYVHHSVTNMLTLLSKQVEEIDLQESPDLAKDPENSVITLMTQLIQEHLEVIREAIGTPVEEVAFWLLLNFDEDQNALFRDRLIQSFKPLGIVCHLLKLEIPQ